MWTYAAADMLLNSSYLHFFVKLTVYAAHAMEALKKNTFPHVFATLFIDRSVMTYSLQPDV